MTIVISILITIIIYIFIGVSLGALNTRIFNRLKADKDLKVTCTTFLMILWPIVVPIMLISAFGILLYRNWYNKLAGIK